MDGLVEMCYYFPSRYDTNFTDAIQFLNLRGDAQKHPKQVEFLQKVSFISVVLITEESINEKTIKVLESLTNASSEIVVLLGPEQNVTKSGHIKPLQLLQQALFKSYIIQLKNKNWSTIKKEIQERLAERLSNAKPEHFKAISDCYHIAKETGIKIDEDHNDSNIGRKYADMVMNKIYSVKYNEVKDKMLPLQGPPLWHHWAKHDKEHHRHIERKGASVAVYNEQKHKDKMVIRNKQLNQCTTLTPLMNCFIEHLLESNGNVRTYFLLWLKLFLDDRSRNILPVLRNKYQETRDQLIALKRECQSEYNPQVRELKEKLAIQNKELINASFGLEDLFREMGQIYEARIDSGGYEIPQSLKDKANCLPQIMAEIMDEGNALELMDGDASHVPTLWVLAVIEKLKAVCGKNAREKNGGKIFVLSVLGIQSTGKSALLNTMFGLHFNVSAGRCTRGAYIQLLPLNNSLRQMIDCDYVLIVDTEGLRAPQLQLEGLKHDNELATFVIGLADATIINIFGETPDDLYDILQISLHAFIRMRKVEMNPSCLFVHQNVPDVLASSKSKFERRKFHSKLDNMTQAAAKVEKCERLYNTFNDVIAFDESNDVFYFPSLWKRNPPMAPVNVGYSERAQKLKTALVKLIHKKQTCRCYLEVFKLRVKSLWEAVLQENFVFNFKNTLEVCAYDELDSQYAQWSWSLQSKMLEWENVTMNTINSTIESEITLRRVAEYYMKVAYDMLSTLYNEILIQMESFFNNSDHSVTLSQWKFSTKAKFMNLRDKSKRHAIEYCDVLVVKRLNHALIDELNEGFIRNIEYPIRELAERSWKTGRKCTEMEIISKFEEIWEKLVVSKIMNAPKVNYPSDYEIEVEIIAILRELLLPASDALIIEKLSSQPLNSRSSSLTLTVDEKVHLRSVKRLRFVPLNTMDATELTKRYLTEAQKYLDKIQVENFNSTLVYKLLRDLISSVEGSKNTKFTFTPEYKVDLALVVCAYALDVFKQIMRKIKVDNDPMAKLHTLKNTFFTGFKNEYDQAYSRYLLSRQSKKN